MTRREGRASFRSLTTYDFVHTFWGFDISLVLEMVEMIESILYETSFIQLIEVILWYLMSHEYRHEKVFSRAICHRQPPWSTVSQTLGFLRSAADDESSWISSRTDTLEVYLHQHPSNQLFTFSSNAFQLIIKTCCHDLLLIIVKRMTQVTDHHPLVKFQTQRQFWRRMRAHYRCRKKMITSTEEQT